LVEYKYIIKKIAKQEQISEQTFLTSLTAEEPLNWAYNTG
jgi:hypothetical protein